MRNKKCTKSAFVISILSLVLCLSMLVGTTFAWFTKSVTSANNRILAGNLELSLYEYKSINEEPKTWVDISNQTAPIFGDSELQPGATEVHYLKIENTGNLTFEYQINIVANVAEFTELANVVEVYTIDRDVTTEASLVNEFEGEEEGFAGYMTSNDWSEKMTLKEFVQSFSGVSIENSSTRTGVLDPDQEERKVAYFAIALHLPNQLDNKYNGMDLGGTFDIQIVATQAPSESDSFDSNYDTEAMKSYEGWTGAIDTSWYVGEKDSYDISSAEQLAGLAKLVNDGTDTFEGKTVILTKDIDLENLIWTPIGTSADSNNRFKGTFDGGNHTISNLRVVQSAGYHAAGLFGALNGTVRNLIIDGAYIDNISSGKGENNSTTNGTAVVAGSIYTSGTIYNCHVTNAAVNGNRYVGGIAGYVYGSITNCAVSESTITATPDNLTENWDNGDKVGGIAGYFPVDSNNVIQNNTVENTTIKGYRDFGGIVGFAGDVARVTGNQISEIEIIVNQISEYNYKGYTSDNQYDAGSIVGEANCGEVDESNTGEATITYITEEETQQ